MVRRGAQAGTAKNGYLTALLLWAAKMGSCQMPRGQAAAQRPTAVRYPEGPKYGRATIGVANVGDSVHGASRRIRSFAAGQVEVAAIRGVESSRSEPHDRPDALSLQNHRGN